MPGACPWPHLSCRTASCTAVRAPRLPQVAQYESNGANGTLHPGCPVSLSWDYKRHGEAREGPLQPGKVGVVVEDGLSETGAYVVKVRAAHEQASFLWGALGVAGGVDEGLVQPRGVLAQRPDVVREHDDLRNTVRSSSMRW